MQSQCRRKSCPGKLLCDAENCPLVHEREQMKVTVFMTVTHTGGHVHLRDTARREMVIEIDPEIMAVIAGDGLTAENAMLIIGCRLGEAEGLTVLPAEE